MKQKLLFLWLAFLLGVTGATAKEAYAYYLSTDKSLNFCYDDNKSSRQQQGHPVYSLNVGSNYPEWTSIAAQVEELYFYSSFADYRPTTCYSWADGMTNLVRVKNLANLNTSNVTNMKWMFYNCKSLTSLDLSGLNTANVTNMASMFIYCSNLTSLNLSGFNTSKVTNMKQMFYGCSKLTSLDLHDFDISKVTVQGNLDEMLRGCTSLKTLSLSSTMANSSLFDNNACYGVGTTSSPCSLNYPTTSHLSYTSITPDYVVWKGGYFKSQNMHAYAVLNNGKLTFWYDDYFNTAGTNYNLNTGSNQPGWHSSASSVTSVVFDSSFKNARPTSCYEWFDSMTNLTSITGMASNLNTSHVTNMQWMFYECSSLGSLDVSGFDTNNVTNISGMFTGCSKLTSLTGLTNFNTTNVTSMASMFYGCSSLTSLDVSGFDTSNVTNMSGMFFGCSKLVTLTGFINFNTSKVTNMSNMFYGCTNLPNINLSKSNFSKLTSSSGFMSGCTTMKTILLPSSANNLASNAFSGVGTTSSPCMLIYPNDLELTIEDSGSSWFKWKGGYFYTGESEAYAFLSTDSKTLTFYYDKKRYTRTGGTQCAMNEFEEPGWYDKRASITKVVFNSSFASARPESCYWWFNGMTNLTAITGMNYLNTSQVVDMVGMFANCSKLTSIDLSNFSTASADFLSSMFKGCSSLTNLDVSKFNTRGADHFSSMFEGCSSLTNLDLSNFDFSGLSDIDPEDYNDSQNFLKGCTSLKTLSIPSTSNNLASNACTGVGTKANPCTLVYPSGFTPEKDATGSGWYQWKSGYFCDALTEAYAWLSSDGKKLTFCYDTQKGSRVGTTYALNTGSNNPGWYDKRADITSVVFNSTFVDAEPTSCYRWFYGMTKLTGITNLKYLNTSMVKNMASMFNGCSSLTSLDLSEFETYNVTTMNYMFYKCSKLTTLDLGSFDTSGVGTMKYMFANCSQLLSVQLYSEKQDFSSFGEPEIPEYETTFTTESITDITSMFEGCSKLAMFEFPGLTLKSSTVTANLCKGCAAMEKVYVTTNTLNYLDATAFDGVGSTTACWLEMPDEFTPNITSRTLPYESTDGVGYVMWKGGKFTDFLDAYAVYMEGTLTFYFDRLLRRWDAGGITPDGPFADRVNTSAAAPGWVDYATSVTKVVFDASFKDYKPNVTYRWFYGFKKLASITNLKYLSTTKTTNMGSMFNGCSSLTSLDLSNFSTAAATNLASLFNGCSKLKSISLTKFNTAKATNMKNMFSNCSALTSLDATKLSTAKATNLSSMFDGCKKLTSLDLSKFTLTASQTTTNMMQNCTALKTLTIPSTANYLDASACTGVGTKSTPCTLSYPSGFTPDKTASGSGWFQWKSGYFKAVSSGLLGDANGDGEVTINDVQIVVEYVLGNNPSGIVLENAEVTGDNEISINDVSAIVAMVLNGPASIAPNARESLTDVVALTAKGSHCSLHLDNSEPYDAFQLEVVLPEGGSMGNVMLAQGRANGHHVEWHEVMPGRYNVLVYSSNGEAMRDGLTALLHFDIAGCQPDDVSVEGIQMVDGWCKTVLLPSTHGVATGMAWIVDDASEGSNSPYYNTVGIGSNTPQRGVNIKDGRKVLKK